MKNKNRNKWNKKDMKFIFTCHFIPLYHQSQHQPYRQQHVATSEWRATTIRRSAREVAERESDWGQNTFVHRLWWTDERPYLCHQWEKHWFDIHCGYLDLRGGRGERSGECAAVHDHTYQRWPFWRAGVHWRGQRLQRRACCRMDWTNMAGSALALRMVARTAVLSQSSDGQCVRRRYNAFARGRYLLKCIAADTLI